jgi:hypothetical protein
MMLKPDSMLPLKQFLILKTHLLKLKPNTQKLIKLLPMLKLKKLLPMNNTRELMML